MPYAPHAALGFSKCAMVPTPWSTRSVRTVKQTLLFLQCYRIQRLCVHCVRYASLLSPVSGVTSNTRNGVNIVLLNPQSNSLLPKPTIRRSTGLFAGIAASKFQATLARNRRKRRMLELAASSDATTRLRIKFENRQLWRPVEPNALVRFCKTYRPLPKDINAEDKRATLPQAPDLLNNFVRAVYACVFVHLRSPGY